MKGYVLMLFVLSQLPVAAQSQEVTQLMLNYEKLKQLEEILDNMYKGYQTLSEGYARIKGVAEGNFRLHEVFLNGLMEVSPAVRTYHKIPIILRYHKMLVKHAERTVSNADYLSHEDIRYVKSVFNNLVKQSRKGIEELLWVTTAGESRMNDAERISIIDGIYSEASSRSSFLRDFNNEIELLKLQKAAEMRDVGVRRKLHGDE